MKMRQKKYWKQLENSNKKNGKGRIRNNLRLSAEWLPPGKENDAFSTGDRRIKLDIA